jgi:SOS-response transcriptional repressor LexA
MPDPKMLASLISTYGQDIKLPDLADKAGLQYERVRNIAYQRVKSVTDEEVEKIAKALGVPSRREDLPTLVGQPMAKLPIVGSASAGPGTDDHVEDSYAYVPNSVVIPDSVGWIVEGDSMSPWLLPGDIVIVRPHKTPRVGYAMLVRNEAGLCMVKQVILDGSSIMLKSLNPAYPDQPATVEIMGFVTGRYRSVDGYELTESQRDGLRPITW